MLFLQNKQGDLSNLQISHKAHDGSVNLMSLHPSHRQAVKQPRLVLNMKTNSTLIESRGFCSNFYNTPPKTLDWPVRARTIATLETHYALPQRQKCSLEQRLGEEIRHIIRAAHGLQLENLVALRLMHKMLTKIDMLCTVCAPNSSTSPFDARGIILKNRSRILLRESKFLQKTASIN